MKRIFLVLLLCLLPIIAVKPQAKEVIATVGNYSITLEEFKKRFELTPQYDAGGMYRDEIARRNFLYSMIAEKLWSLKSDELGLDSTTLMQNTFTALEKMFIRDGLFKQVIECNVHFDDTDIMRGFQRSKINLYVNFLFSADSTEIFQLHDRLLKGESFDSILITRHELEFQQEPLEIEYGKLPEPVEDMLYPMKNGDFTSPIKEIEGWIIYYLKAKKEKYIPSDENQKVISEVKNTLKARRTDRVYQEFYKKFFGGKKVETNGILFWSLVDKLTFILQAKIDKGEANKHGEVKLRPEDLTTIESQFGPDSLQMVFIQFETNPITLKEFLSTFFFEGFFTNTVNTDIIAAKMNSRIRLMIEQELIARDGVVKGIHNIDEVKSDITMWRDYYMSKLLQNRMKDSVSVDAEELFAYYNESIDDTSSQIEVNILEILTDSLEVIEKVLNAPQTEEEFRRLASIHTKRLWTKDRGGEYGYYPALALGELGKTAVRMKTGDVFGPIQLDEGYSIIMLIGKKQKVNVEQSFDEVKENLENELKVKKYNEMMIDNTVELAEKYGVTINENLLFNTKITNQQMMVFRYMGFGGRITAVPLTQQFIEWVEPWQKRLEKLP